MYLIEANTIPTPADGEQLIEQLWQNAMGRRFGLFIIGQYDEPVKLGVGAHDPDLELSLASLVADFCDAEFSESIIAEEIHSNPHVAALNLHHVERSIPMEGKTWLSQRFDPLRGAYGALARLDEGVIAGIGLTLRPLPSRSLEMRFETSMTCFAAGPFATYNAWKIASTFATAGVQPRRPMRQRRAALRTIDIAFRRPLTIEPLNVVSKFWHPPLKQQNFAVVA